MKLVPHGEPYAGKLHVRFDEGYPPRRRRVAKRCPGRGAGVPHGASRSTLHPLWPPGCQIILYDQEVGIFGFHADAED